MKNFHPVLKQNQIAKQIRISESTIKRYKNDMIMDSLYIKNESKKNSPGSSITSSNVYSEAEPHIQFAKAGKNDSEKRTFSLKKIN